MKAALTFICLITIVKQSQSASDSCSRVPIPSRLDCHPEAHATEQRCSQRNCCWNIVDKDRTTACFFPPDYPTYSLGNVSKNRHGFSVYATRAKNAYPFKDNIDEVRMEVRFETDTRVRIRIVDARKPRWEPSIELSPPDSVPPRMRNYDVELDERRLGFKVVRNDDHLKTVLVDSTEMMASAFVYADQFQQIALAINAEHGFGIGERIDSFPLKLHEWKRMTLWARDQIPRENANLYGVHNFFLGLAADGRSFGVFFLNSNAQEIDKQPLPSLTYRTIGGILDLFVLTGPFPADVISQYYELIGKPPVPPYWSLGFQLSRYGYKNLTEVRETIFRNQKAGIPMDVQWLDIDYMNKSKDWTVNENEFANINSFVREYLHKTLNLNVVIIVDPAIASNDGNRYEPYISGLAVGVFINDSRTGRPLVGSVWPGDTMFPDFSKRETGEWWYKSASNFYEKVNYDGLWIDMNEPSSFIDGSITGCDFSNRFDYPPYLPRVTGDKLFSSTICPSALHGSVPHYNLHNLYALTQAKATREALLRIFPGKRPFILTRSSFAGSGRFAYHWTGDVTSSWDDLAKSIPQILNFNIFGMPFVGADICGFEGDTSEELCIRWSQLGAFYPFARNHNTYKARPQDPAVWSENATTFIANALNLRYQLLPYLYTLLYNASYTGQTVARAMFIEFPTDVNTHAIDKQFLLGSCVLVIPVLEEGARNVYGYIPEGKWVEATTLDVYTSRGQWFVLSSPLDKIPILYRAGCIIPMHHSAPNTKEARKLGIGLMTILGPESKVKNSYRAFGNLIWDDGETDSSAVTNVHCRVVKQLLTCVPVQMGNGKYFFKETIHLSFVKLVGMPKSPVKVKVNGKTNPFLFEKSQQLLTINRLAFIDLQSPLNIAWEF